MKKTPAALLSFPQLALVAAFLLAVLAPPALAASTIKILVNDDPITSYDIQQRTRMLQVFSQGQKGQKDAIDQLIDEKLMMQEAARRRATLSDKELDDEFAKRAQRSKLTPVQFSQAMRQAGFDPATFKQFLRANMEWAQIVRARFRATVDVTDQDVSAVVGKKETTGEQQNAIEYMLQQVLFVVPAGSAPTLVSKRMAEANSFRDGFKGCDQSVSQTSGMLGVVVKPQVRRSEETLPPPLRKDLSALSVGSTTKPERVDEGIQILAVCAKNSIAGQTEATIAARQEIKDERGQLLARRYLRDLRADAVIEYR